MQTAKLFANGRSQAVRLPKDCRLPGRDVYIRKLDGLVILFPKTHRWMSLLKSLPKFSEDFMQDRGQLSAQTRESLS